MREELEVDEAWTTQLGWSIFGLISVAGDSCQFRAALTDIPGYLMEEPVAAYPEALFILKTRDEDAWCRSVKNTFQPVGIALSNASPSPS
ncbi:hypothetical protein QQZ08_009487 [Neonectria magnoliae]|uniref:Uncharacterized protein n=1 Tax=Neonectria magnoliae TaxID=2732573 RepID=A0ABR1HNB8_9HYPO